jgi:glutamate 5-kinase
MISKLQAVKLAVDAGIRTHIASGRKPGQIARIATAALRAPASWPNGRALETQTPDEATAEMSKV